MRKNLRGVADHAAVPLACTSAAHALSQTPSLLHPRNLFFERPVAKIKCSEENLHPEIRPMDLAGMHGSDHCIKPFPFAFYP